MFGQDDIPDDLFDGDEFGVSCEDERVLTIERPAYADDSERTFGYSFFYRPPAMEGLPTIVHIPGGPGGESIQNQTGANIAPDEYGLVLTDPRGVGCSEDEGLDPIRAFTTEQVAADVVAAVLHLGLENYVIYGHSYGSAAATHTAQQAEEAGVPARAVLLEGVLGRATNTPEERSSGYLHVWSELSASIPADSFEVLSNASPFEQHGPQDWGDIIQAVIFLNIPRIEAKLIDVFLLLSDSRAERLGLGSRDERHELAIKQMEEMVSELEALFGAEMGDGLSGELFDQEFFNHVACRELFADEVSRFALEGAELVTIPQGPCGELTLEKPFDAADFAYEAPTYYFLGSRDMQTPVWQGNYHFEHVSSPSRTKVVLERGGHSPLQDLFELDCTHDLVRALSTYNLDAFDAAIEACDAPLTVDKSAL